jgi:hypothetical protein
VHLMLYGVPEEIRPWLVYIERFRYTWECMCGMGDCEVKMFSLNTAIKVLNGSIILCECGCGGWPIRDTMTTQVKGDVRNNRFCGALFSQVVCNSITYNFMYNDIVGGGANMGNNNGDYSFV